MRIISDFHDYYDSVQAVGQNQTLVYIRKSEEVEVQEYPFPVFRFARSFGSNERCQPQVCQHIVGFCGKIYPVLVLTHVATNSVAVCHSLDDVDRFIEHNFRPNLVAEYNRKAKRRWRWQDWPCSSRDAFDRHFAACAAKKDSFVEVFVAKGCPVFVGTAGRYNWRALSGKIVYNACLKDLEFFRLFDIYTAFQEIAVYLGGLATPQKEIPQVPDKIMVGVKGFDEWSFRKPPQRR